MATIKPESTISDVCSLPFPWTSFAVSIASDRHSCSVLVGTAVFICRQRPLSSPAWDGCCSHFDWTQTVANVAPWKTLRCFVRCFWATAPSACSLRWAHCEFAIPPALISLVYYCSLAVPIQLYESLSGMFGSRPAGIAFILVCTLSALER